ncbi:30S ribosomal protein S9 [Akkermansiaceae bacterium]|nr:30S ribosomal protein S9 [Akkermansiaceae bacterium]
MSETTYSATGRRKTAVAHVSMTPGTGKIKVNKTAFEDYFPTISQQNGVLEPLQLTSLINKFDLTVVVKGGGVTGQIGAIRLAIARSLIQHDIELRPTLKAALMLRRDPRMKERKKYGQPGARANFQFSKR